MIKKSILSCPLFLALLLFGLNEIALGTTADQLQQANTYLRNKDYSQAETRYKEILTTVSADSHEALVAQGQLTNLYILAGKQTEADAAFSKLTTEFASHKNIANAIWHTGLRYKWRKKYDKAKEVHQYNVENFPGRKGALRSQMEIICQHIANGEDTVADATVAEMLTVFAQQPYLVRAIYKVAHEYERAGRVSKAVELWKLNVQRAREQEFTMLSQVRIIKHHIRNENDIVAAKEALEVLLNSYFGWPGLPREIFKIAKWFGEAGEVEKAVELHNYNVSNFPGNKHVAWSEAYLTILYGVSIDSEDHIISKLRSIPSDPVRYSETLYKIAELYCQAAMDRQRQNKQEEAREYLGKAIAEWERLIAESPESDLVASSYDMAANCYKRLGQHAKATECYEAIIEQQPDYEYVWNSMFKLGRAYQASAKSGALGKSEADGKTEAVYRELIQKYPTCKAAPIVQRWLLQHGENN